jgi:hypothetical protein
MDGHAACNAPEKCPYDYHSRNVKAINYFGDKSLDGEMLLKRILQEET